MKVLVINSGSSSIKYRLFDMQNGSVLAEGLVEKIGEPAGRMTHFRHGHDPAVIECNIGDHSVGMSLIAGALIDPEKGAVANASEIDAIGHRVVHGGESFLKPALIDPEVMEAIKKNAHLAPLHNPPNLTGIEVARAVFPGVPQVAVFDTAFHQTLPEEAFLYGLPPELYKKHGIRRYGFHGTSHCHAAKTAARTLERPLNELNLITVHLGNGSSITAVRDGESVDTSMGMTPLEGLVMGTRCGDIDPSIIFYLAESAGMSLAEVKDLLNTGSGLKGMTGTNDMREVIELMEKGDAGARLAVDMYAYRVKKYVGAYFAALGGVDAIVFTGGIGENSPHIRKKSLSGLEGMGISIDPEKNRGQEPGVFFISPDNSPVRVLVIPANEELEIAVETVEVLKGG